MSCKENWPHIADLTELISQEAWSSLKKKKKKSLNVLYSYSFS